MLLFFGWLSLATIISIQVTWLMKSLRTLSLTNDPINLTRDSWFGSNLSYFAANTKDPKLISVDIFFMWKCYLDLAENLFSFPYTLCLPLPKGFFKLTQGPSLTWHANLLRSCYCLYQWSKWIYLEPQLTLQFTFNFFWQPVNGGGNFGFGREWF